LIQYLISANELASGQLNGFFVGWPSPPSATTHLRLLRQSAFVSIALDDSTGNVVGFATAISDGVLSAYIPLLEVLPAYQGQGVGRALVQHLLEQLQGIYMIDLTCDSSVQPFYEQLGMRRSTSMLLRNYEFQSGHPVSAIRDGMGD
jgi:ribosomal protein S18 acetylase RimI-like enzyme